MLLCHAVRDYNTEAIFEILRDNTIKAQKKRQALSNGFPFAIESASASFICPGYTASYAKQGVIFETDEMPYLWSPVDVYHLLCNGVISPGIEQFHFKSLDDLLKKYPNSGEAGRAIERWKRQHGSCYVNPGVYNKICSELVYLGDIPITPVATFGYPNLAAGLPNYASARDFFIQSPWSAICSWISDLTSGG